MKRRIVEASMIPIGLTYKAWGHRWLTDEQCQALVTWIMQTTLWLVREPVPPR